MSIQKHIPREIDYNSENSSTHYIIVGHLDQQPFWQNNRIGQNH